MQSYEVMFIFRPDLKEEEQKALVAQLEKILKDNQATIEGEGQVFGRRALAYELKKYKEGLYYLINFSSAQGAACSKLKQACNINENVLRTLIIRKGKKLGGGSNA